MPIIYPEKRRLNPHTDKDHIVSVSSGLGSAFAWKLVCDQYGPANVTGVFCDVNGEHPDNYRFLAEIQYALGSRLIKITNDGKTIWDVMIENKFLANSRIDTCSKILKRQAFLNWLQEHAGQDNAVIYLGIDWTEIHRLDKAIPQWAKTGYIIEAPLCKPPYYHKSDAQTWFNEIGIKRPALYDLGFTHANCGGGCVKAGIGQFINLYRKDRNWYMNWWEAGENKVRHALNRNVSILRERGAGVSSPLTLTELRHRIERGTQPQVEDEGQGCGVCFLAP